MNRRTTRHGFLPGRLVAAGLVSVLPFSQACAGPVAQENVSIRQAPAWVVTRDLDYSYVPEAGAVRDGTCYLLVDEQRHLGEGATYGRYARKFLRISGIEEGSSINIDFDPAYQTLEFHSVEVIRDNQRINKLNLANVKLVQRERGLGYNVYDGSLSAVIFVSDVRIGDVIEYSFTIRGVNPVFEGRYAGAFPCGWPDPLAHFHQRVIVPVGRSVKTRSHGETSLFPVSQIRADGGLEITWAGESIPGIVSDSETPDWVDTFPWVEISEFADWHEVAVWGSKLYREAEAAANPASIREKAGTFSRPGASVEDTIVSVIRFVQDEVRYLGMHAGTGSHKPEPPDLVLEQRHSDCKGKALLLCVLLREIGIKAWPALVDSDQLGFVARQLPSPRAFDHVIVAFEFGGRIHWVDPTISDQGGAVGSIIVPPYGRALILNDSATDLATIPARGTEADFMRITEEFRIPVSRNPVTMRALTEYYGAAADRVRSYFVDSTSKEIERRCVNFYAFIYPDIALDGPVAVMDDRFRNTIRVEERFKIFNIWKSDGERRTSEYVPKALLGWLSKPGQIQRLFPLKIAHPRKLEQNITIHLPQEWQATPISLQLNNAAFNFAYRASSMGKIIFLLHSYSTKAQEITPADVPQYVRDLDAIFATVGYELSEPLPPALRRLSGALGAVAPSDGTSSVK